MTSSPLRLSRLTRAGQFLALLLAVAGGVAQAEDAAAPAEEHDSEAAAPDAPFIALTVPLNEVEFAVEIDMDGTDPGEVRVGRADGKPMPDEGYRARDVITIACRESGLTFDDTVTGTLSPDGRWLFQKGCR